MRIRGKIDRSVVVWQLASLVGSLAISALAGYAFVMSGRSVAEQPAQAQRSKPAQPGPATRIAVAPRKPAVDAAPVDPARPRAAKVLSHVDQSAGNGIDPRSDPVDLAVLADGNDTDPDASTRPWVARTGTWRTVCVRLCDGALIPLSFATTRDRFGADRARCEASCSSPARMYVMPPTAEPEELVDLAGGKYTDLPTAFRFRTSFDPACTCREPAQVRTEIVANATSPPAVGTPRTVGVASLDLRKDGLGDDAGEVPQVAVKVTVEMLKADKHSVETSSAETQGANGYGPATNGSNADGAVNPHAPVSKSTASPSTDPASADAVAPATRPRKPARGIDTVRVDGPEPIQGQGSVAQAKIAPNKVLAAPQVSPVKPATDAVVGKPKRKATVAVASVATTKPRRASGKAGSGSEPSLARVRTFDVALAAPAKRRRPDLQRPFNSPDFWRLSFWQPN